MSCDEILKNIPLYFYGELPPEEEDQMDLHFHECAACAREMEHQRTLAAAFDRRREVAPAMLLQDCREDLMAAIQGGAPRLKSAEKGPWTLFLEAVSATFAGMTRFRQPVAALALLGIGFFAAKYSGAWMSSTPALPGGPVASLTASSADDVFTTVRSVHPDPSGRVRITYDETRRREVLGRMDDQSIQKLMLTAAQEDNPAVRVESVGLLKGRTGSSEVRDALLNAVAHDPNDGVRLRALEGLKPLATDAAVRQALTQVLVSDTNPAVRMQAIDLLMTHRDDSMVGVLQNLVQKEENSAVRLKYEKALKEMNASIGTF